MALKTPKKPVISNADWRAEVQRRFGKDPKAWRFRCPSCGNEASVGDFIALGADGKRAPSECIGRVLLEQGKSRDEVNGGTRPCDWAAFGMFELASIVRVERPDGGTALAFPFADAPTESEATR